MAHAFPEGFRIQLVVPMGGLNFLQLGLLLFDTLLDLAKGQPGFQLFFGPGLPAPHAVQSQVQFLKGKQLPHQRHSD